jgi:hypothetical protein
MFGIKSFQYHCIQQYLDKLGQKEIVNTGKKCSISTINKERANSESLSPVEVYWRPTFRSRHAYADRKTLYVSSVHICFFFDKGKSVLLRISDSFPVGERDLRFKSEKPYL